MVGSQARHRDGERSPKRQYDDDNEEIYRQEDMLTPSKV
jgi:hypothetical protein